MYLILKVMLEDILVERGVCQSNDQHVIALAIVSGARLLYSNDRRLQRDFKDRRLIDPPGKVYSTRRGKRSRDTGGGCSPRASACVMLHRRRCRGDADEGERWGSRGPRLTRE